MTSHPSISISTSTVVDSTRCTVSRGQPSIHARCWAARRIRSKTGRLKPDLARVDCRIPWTLSVCWKLDVVPRRCRRVIRPQSGSKHQCRFRWSAFEGGRVDLPLYRGSNEYKEGQLFVAQRNYRVDQHRAARRNIGGQECN